MDTNPGIVPADYLFEITTVPLLKRAVGPLLSTSFDKQNGAILRTGPHNKLFT